MSAEDPREEVPARYVYVGAAIALAILAYALLFRQLFLGLVGVLVVLCVGVSLVVVRLLYRLVAAIERISYKL